MQISIIGAGYVGTTMAACLLNDGHKVLINEIDHNKSQALSNGIAPIYEPGVNELLKIGLENNRLLINSNIETSVSDADILFVCVGTPSNPDGSLFIDGVLQVTKSIINALDKGARSQSLKPLLIVFRSTLPPGTMDAKILPLFEKHSNLLGSLCEIAFNPEFLREATAVDDYYSPPKIIIGERGKGLTHLLLDLYVGLKAPIFHVDFKTAELVKIIDNTWHGLKVAFTNEVARLCNSLEISPSVWSETFRADTKLNISGYYMRPGGAFGGSCLPKDIKGVLNIANRNSVDCPVITSIVSSNERHKKFILNSVTSGLREGSKILLLGLSFKKGTDDIRDSPLLELAESLLHLGFDLRIYDPDLASSNLEILFSGKFHNSLIEAIFKHESDSLTFNPDLVVIGKRIDSLNKYNNLGVRVFDIDTL